MANKVEKKCDELGLTVSGRLRLAAELVSTVSRLPVEERDDVAEKALRLAQSAVDEINTGLLEMRRRKMAHAAGVLLDRIKQRSESQNVLTSDPKTSST